MQSKKALSSIKMVELGITIVCKVLFPPNALLGMHVTPLGITMFVWYLSKLAQ